MFAPPLADWEMSLGSPESRFWDKDECEESMLVHAVRINTLGWKEESWLRRGKKKMGSYGHNTRFNQIQGKDLELGWCRKGSP